MANDTYKRKTFDFVCSGMNLSSPVDKIPDDKYRILFNVRPYGDNQIWARQGITQESSNSVADAIHSIKRMNDPIPDPSQFPGSFADHLRIVGHGTSLAYARADSGASPVFLTTLTDAGYSGNPLSFAVSSGDFNPRPWMYIGDSNKMRKISSSALPYQIGLPHPNFAPTLSTGAGSSPAGTGPDVGTTGLGYIYRFVGRLAGDINTGVTSAPGPPVREVNAIYPGRGDPGDPAADTWILVDAPAAAASYLLATGSPVPYLDVYRFGGSLPEWIYVGTISNYVGSQFTEIFSDDAIASNPRLEWQPENIHYQPFTTLTSTKSGRCNVTRTGTVCAVAIQSGDTMEFYAATADTSYLPSGTQISVDGRACTMYNSPTTANDVELVEDLQTSLTDVPFIIETPELVRTPLPFIWGPFGAGQTGVFLFGCGSAIRPGTLYWTKGNNAEANPPSHHLDITDGSERLQNGCMYDGRSFVFSTERLFGIYPSFGQTSDFIAVEVPDVKGLYCRWGLCWNGPAMYFIARDGIYATTGGQAVCISDDIAPLFAHEQSSTLPNPFEGISPATFPPPNWSDEDALRLSFADGYLHFDYIDTTAARRTLVFDADPMSHGRRPNQMGWVSRDSYTPGILIHYQEEGADVHNVLMGSSDGKLFVYGGYSDNGADIAGRVRPGAKDLGDTRARYHFGDVWLDYDSDCESIIWEIGFDNYTFFSEEITSVVDLTGRQQSIGDINSGTGQYARNIGLDIEWTVNAAQLKLYAWEPSFLPKPELTILRVTDWTDCAYKGDKFFQGCRVNADTLGAARTIQIHSDGGTVAKSLTVTHSGELIKPYSWTPFITHMVRFLPTDVNGWRLFDVEWIWEPAPDLTENWVTQETTYDLQGFLHHRDAYVAAVSSAAITWNITVDGTAHTYTIPSTASAYLKQYVVLQPMKGKYAKHSLTSPSPFRLFLKDCEVRVKSWGDPGPYQVKLPFGDFSRQIGARI